MFRLVKRGGVVLASIVLALAVAELALRALTPPTFPERVFPNSDSLRVDPLLGWRNEPGIRAGRLVVAGFASRSVLETNARGFRGPEVEAPKPAGRVRVACLGDSGTFGLWWAPGAADGGGSPADPLLELDGYPQALREGLVRAGYDDVEVLNAGVLGYNVSQALRQLVLDVLPLEPDVVLLRIGFNDHSRAWAPELRVREPRGALGRGLLYGLAPLRLTRLAFAAYRSAAFLHPPPNSLPWVTPDEFEEALVRFAELSRRRGFALLLLDYPLAPPGRVRPEAVRRMLYVSGEATEGALRAAHERYQEIERRVAQREGATLLETSPVLLASAETSFSSEDLVHPARAGSERIAHRVLAELVSRGWLAARSGPGRSGAATQRAAAPPR